MLLKRAQVLVYISLVLVVLSCCSDNPDKITPEIFPLIENALTLETAFGAVGLPDEYLLVKPDPHIGINYNGDIIIGDEARLKVFDSVGNPKLILGRPGQGPGEYNHAFPLIISDNYITGMDNPFGLNLRYNLYTSDYERLETKDPARTNMNRRILADHPRWKNLTYLRLFHYSRNRKLIFTGIVEKKDLLDKKIYSAVILQENDDYTILVCEERKGIIPNVSNEITGKVYFTPLSGQRFAWTNTSIERNNNNNVYSVYIYDIEKREQTIIAKDYSPTIIPDSVIYRNSRLPTGFPKDMVNIVNRRDKSRTETLLILKHYPPLQRITSDGDYIFAYTWTYDPGLGWLTDVLDSKTGKHVSSTYFPAVIRTIKNGFAYEVHTTENAFPELRKYRIDPQVYGIK